MEKLLNAREVIERTNDDRSVSKADVNPRSLDVGIWQGMVSLPGCLPHSTHCAMSRKQALAFLRDYARDEEGRVPRGLSREFAGNGEGCFYGKRYAYELVSMTVRELF